MILTLFNIVFNLINTFLKGLSILTIDKEYLMHRAKFANKEPINISEGIKLGAINLAYSVNDALSGIFLKPFESFRKYGFVGIFRGIYQVVIGILLKPILGLYDSLLVILQVIYVYL